MSFYAICHDGCQAEAGTIRPEQLKKSHEDESFQSAKWCDLCLLHP
jgi:hypothetical protein